jgi:hypothetical protein
MINDGINDVPDNTIAMFNLEDLSQERIDNILSPIEKKRDWFTPHFYRCLPLSIANQYGYVIKSEYDFTLEWNGGDDRYDIKWYFNDDIEKVKTMYPRISSHFGHGIITIDIPFMFRTPPGINLMTINPPNYVLSGITVMSGSVETDNLRYTFTVNLKINTPETHITIPKGFPLAAIIPVKRDFIESFKMKNAEDVMSEDLVLEELNAYNDQKLERFIIERTLKNNVNQNYMFGRDVYGNKFKDHQKP